MRRTRIKICGITRLDDALYVARLGADSIGLVFHASSSRRVDLETAERIRKTLPPFVTVTALFLNETKDWITEVVQTVRPDCLQFHGQETAVICESFKLPYVKAIPMASTVDVQAYAASYPGAQGLLLDSHVAGRQGGSGDTFDWSTVPDSLALPFILAGGLNPQNIAVAITQLRPWGVDVSSGVEISKGIKDRTLISQLFNEVNRVDIKV